MNKFSINGNSGANRLAGIIQKRLNNSRSMIRSAFDYGVIQNDMSLLTNNFPQPIPLNDYMVCRCVTQNAVGNYPLDTSTEIIDFTLPDGSTVSNSHSHNIFSNENIQPLKPHDRVLVAWVGADPCVVDVVLSAEKGE